MRVTEAQVKDIMEEEVLEKDLTPYIRTANLIVNTHLSDVYPEELLTEVELWLTAHFASTARYRQIQMESVLDSKTAYDKKDNLTGLESTTYGQQVNLLDYKSIISNLQKTQVFIKTIKYVNA